MVSRAERSAFGDWWWTVDRLLLAGLAILMLAGLVILMEGGPPVAPPAPVSVPTPIPAPTSPPAAATAAPA